MLSQSLLGIKEDVTQVLVLGAAGAGTTLLECCLGAHPDIAMVDEDRALWFLKLIGKPVVGTKLCLPHQIQYDKRARFFGPNLDYRIRVSSTVLSTVQRIGLLRYWPQCHFSILDLMKMLPRLKIIGIVRERESNIRSMMKIFPQAHTPRFVNPAEHVQWWYESAAMTIDMMHSNEQCEVVAFEEFIRSPEPILKSLCTHIGVGYDKRMLQGVQYNFRYPRRTIGEGVRV